MRKSLKPFFIIILYLITKQINDFLIMFLFVLIHEMGHIITGVSLGFKIKRFDITFAGVMIELDTYKKDSLLKRIVIDVAGPLVNLIFIIVGEIIKSEIIVYSNLLIMILNLLPIYPLDGGRIIRNFLLLKNDFKNTVDIVNTISNITLFLITLVSSILILYYKNIAIVVLIGYLWYINYIENKRKSILDKVYKILNENIENGT